MEVCRRGRSTGNFFSQLLCGWTIIRWLALAALTAHGKKRRMNPDHVLQFSQRKDPRMTLGVYMRPNQTKFTLIASMQKFRQHSALVRSLVSTRWPGTSHAIWSHSSQALTSTRMKFNYVVNSADVSSLTIWQCLVQIHCVASTCRKRVGMLVWHWPSLMLRQWLLLLQISLIRRCRNQLIWCLRLRFNYTTDRVFMEILDLR